MSRITEIKANLEELKKSIKPISIVGEIDYAECRSQYKTTLTENIKEADAMIFELKDIIKNLLSKTITDMEYAMDNDASHQPHKPYRDIVRKYQKKRNDWQNLKVFLQNSLDSQSSSKKELEMMKNG